MGGCGLHALVDPIARSKPFSMFGHKFGHKFGHNFGRNFGQTRKGMEPLAPSNRVWSFRASELRIIDFHRVGEQSEGPTCQIQTLFSSVQLFKTSLWLEREQHLEPLGVPDTNLVQFSSVVQNIAVARAGATSGASGGP